jgi:hypothetical protein
MDELRQASADLQQTENLTPPPELVQQLIGQAFGSLDQSDFADPIKLSARLTILVTRAAQWGAEAELDACCERLTLTHGQWELAAALRAARRPKPLSLAEEVLMTLNDMDLGPQDEFEAVLIRRALERLQQLEEQQ